MRLVKTVRVAAAALRGRPLRSLLSTAGVVCGVASVLTMAAIGEGARRDAAARIEHLGTRNILLRALDPAGAPAVRAPGAGWLAARDAGVFAAAVPGVVWVAPVRHLAPPAAVAEKAHGVEAMAVTRAAAAVLGLGVATGRFVTDLDVTQRSAVCVLGAEAAALLGRAGREGAVLRWGDRAFTVVGVLEPRSRVAAGPVPSRDLNRQIMVPLGAEPGAAADLDELVVQVRDTEQVQAAAAVVRRILASRPGGAAPIQIVVPLELLREAARARRTSTLVLGTIAAISLLVGGIGIANVMLAVVSERRREIGIRRAVGATRGDVAAQFVAETLLLTVAGALAGLAAGAAGAWFVGQRLGWPVGVSPWAVLLAIGMAVVVGLAAGVAPALAASRLDPVEAISGA